MALDSQSSYAFDFARSAVPIGARLDHATFVACLLHTSDLAPRFPGLSAQLGRRSPLRLGFEDVELDGDLQAVIAQLQSCDESLPPVDVLRALLARSAARSALLRAGVTPAVLGPVLESLGLGDEALNERVSSQTPAGERSVRSGWRSSRERREVLAKLDAYGRLIGAQQRSGRGLMVHEDPLLDLLQQLVQMKRRSCILHGPSGCGKTALVHELAQRLAEGHVGIPAMLAEYEIFELDPNFLRAGASLVGQYDQRVKELIQLLEAHPRIILFVDEVHTLFQSSMHHKGPHSQANESFKTALSRGSVTIIGATTTREYHHYIAPDTALKRRFGVIELRPPSPAQIREILRSRRPRLQAHFHLDIPEELSDRVLELCEQHMSPSGQPDRALQLFEKACAIAITRPSPAPALTEAHLDEALQRRLGHPLFHPGDLDLDRVYGALTARLKGQDDVLERVARAFVTGMGGWRSGQGPRGAFMFAGPTGVGKTQAALLLARLLGGSHRPALIRVDCNTLQGSRLDPGPAINRLLGVPKGYVGYVAGQGGMLSAVRDQPVSVVLFDEIEKAPPGVGDILLRILDEGQERDSEDNLLDFRRSFLVFTTNAGCSYETVARSPDTGFGLPQRRRLGRVEVHTDEASVRQAFLDHGLGQEFLARLHHIFVFHALDREATRSIVQAQLVSLAKLVSERGYKLQWSHELVEHLLSQWQAAFGVRHLTSILRNRIIEQLSLAQAQGGLSGVELIELRPLERPAGLTPELAAGLAQLHRDGDDDSRIVILLG
jgi:ATP-dependent Clp protease ATP-binding subunit ClpA